MSLISRISNGLKNKEFSCVELTQKYLDSIDKNNGSLNAYVYISDQEALSAAKAVDEKINNGIPLEPLEGIPMSLKDNISTNGLPTTCCSKILENYSPIFDAFVWDLLKKNNSVLLGKSNMDEFALGSSSETSFYGAPLNPHNKNKVTGGSSGGAACAVAANLAVYSLGSDTGGSIRQPASFCGAVGLKPTYGAVSRYGLMAYASSFDQIGPITNCVEDAAIVFDAINKYDPMDSTSSPRERTSVLTELKDDVKGLKIGIASEFLEGISPDIRKAFEASIQSFKDMGAQIVEVSTPFLKYAVPVYYILSCAEASSNLARYDGIRYGYKTDKYTDINDMIVKTRSEGFGKEAKRRIMLGTYTLSSGYYDAYYKKAQNLRGSIIEQFKEIFQQCDIIASPTSPSTAFPLNFTINDPVKAYLTDIYTVPVNIAGLPGISVPCGQDSENMPIGLQLIGNYFDEKSILKAAYSFEQNGSFSYKPLDMGVQL